MEQENIRKAMEWRYATKKFDPAKKISEKDFNFLLETTCLSASSFGLQPFKIIVVKNFALREKLKDSAWNQSQVTDASHFVVFAAKKTMTEKDIQEFIALVSKERNLPLDALNVYRDMMLGFVKSNKPEFLAEWTKKQAYIALGTLLETVALLKIDACPMEGFDASRFDLILELDKQCLASAVVCALGYRSPDDESAKYKKVRFPASTLVITKS